MHKRKICVVTGSRAEYGLLRWVMQEIKDSPELELQLVVTGMHLSPEFGQTYQVILEDGFEIVAKVEMLLSSDTPVGITKSLGLGIIGFADTLDRLQPDLLLVLGDRYEILAAVQAALITKVPVAHIAGGDTTEGAFDESIRHSITKMSHLHFVTNQISAQRVRQLGEDPAHIHNVGSPGLDNINRLKLLDRTELAKVLEFDFRTRNLLITFHPVTLDRQPASDQFQELLNALDDLGSDIGLIFTKPNADTDGRVLIRMIDEYVATRPNAKAYTSLGQLKYLSTIAIVDAVVGNSSSGIYEVPALKKPSVNIGNRQKGRLQASSVINCPPIRSEILQAIHQAFNLDCSETVNPYGEGECSKQIVTLLKAIPNLRELIQKHFYEVN